MRSLLPSYVPRYVVDELLQDAHQHHVGIERRLDVVALFADVSGFSQMSEALGRVGKHGSEELTALLNSYFAPMIDLIQSYGGIIGKFGGDAMMVLFPYTDANRPLVVRQAIQCAFDMQADMARYAAMPSSVGTLSLGMKVGLAMGPILCITVGDPTIRLEPVIAGGTLDRCAAAEHHARRGEIVIHNDLLRDAGEIVVVDRRDDFWCINALQQRVQHADLPPLEDIPEEIVPTLATFLPQTIAQRLLAGQAGFLNEHRKVTAVWVSIDEFDYDNDPYIGTTLQHYISGVIRTVHRYDGYLNRVDMGDKGSKYLVLFGTPIIHEDDEERAIRCALDLRVLGVLFAELDPEVRIGVSSGFMYCGHVGSPVRQEYTVMGDAVILAVRLMQAAKPGQILVSGFTHRYIAEKFAWEHFDPIRVKGRSEPVPLYAVRGSAQQAILRLHEPTYAIPMVGRVDELAQAQLLIERAAQGQGQIIRIVAEAGLGKSRLNAAIIERATAYGFIGYTGACQSYGSATSYLVWHNIWRGFFDVDPDWPIEAQVRQLESQLGAITPNLVQRLPLLGAALNSSIPDNDLTRSLDTQLRHDLLKSLLLTCLRKRVAAGPSSNTIRPVVLALEDCHWIDPLSQDLIEFLGRNLADLPVLMIVVHRVLEARSHPFAHALQFPHVTTIELSDLPEAEAEQLVGLKIADRFGLAPAALTIDAASGRGAMEAVAALTQRITAKAEGSPFYIEELVNFLHDRGIDPRDVRAQQVVDLPDNLHSVILSRIDKLTDGQQITLKVASVVGRLFKATWLWGSYPKLGAPEHVKQHLDVLSRLDLTPLDKPEPELEYLFRHITTQEVAYDSLARLTRSELHESIGQFIERTYSDTLAQYVNILAHHFGHSHNTDKQRIYFRRAADAAKATYANQTAIDYYQRLVLLLPSEAQGDVLLQMGEVLQLIGKWSEAEEAFRRALAIAEQGGDEMARAQCEGALGFLLSYTSSFNEAVERLERARAVFEALDEKADLVRTLESLSYVYAMQSAYTHSLKCAEQQLQIAITIGDDRGVSSAYANMGIAFMYQGELERALELQQQALDVSVASNYVRGIVHSSGDIAGVYWQQGDYGHALSFLQQALAAALGIGYLSAAGIIIGNAGLIYYHRGDYTNAAACYRQALQLKLELGEWTAIYQALSNIADLFKSQQQYDAAEHLYMLTVALGRKLEIPYAICYGLYHQADLLFRSQQLELAQQMNDEALAVATQVEDKETIILASLLAIRLRAARYLFDIPTAIGQLEALKDAWQEPSEQAAIDYTIWQLDRTRQEARQSAQDLYGALYEQTANAEYRKRYEELSGRRLPEPPSLPVLSEVITEDAVELEELLERVDSLSERMLSEHVS